MNFTVVDCAQSECVWCCRNVESDELLSSSFHRKRIGVRGLFRWAWIYFLYFSGALRWARRKAVRSAVAVVLTFHRVLDDSDYESCDSPVGMAVRSRTFEKLLAYLRATSEVVNLDRESLQWREQRSLPAIALTFDDGWKDTSEIACRIAAKYEIPVTVFVCPALVGQVSPFWPEVIIRTWRRVQKSTADSKGFCALCSTFFAHKTFAPGDPASDNMDDLISCIMELKPSERNSFLAELLPFTGQPQVSPLESTMSWEDVSRMTELAFCIGSHSQHHEIVSSLPLEEARREIADSKAEIQSRLGIPCNLFAYPNGSWSREVRDLVEKAGYARAFVNSPGLWTTETDPWLIPRINIWEGAVIGMSGNFSRLAFEYSVFWRACRVRAGKSDAREVPSSST